MPMRLLPSYLCVRMCATAPVLLRILVLAVAAIAGMFSVVPTAAFADESNEAIIVGAEFESVPLAGHLEFFLDPEARLGIGDVASPEGMARFKPVNGTLSLGYVTDAAWVRFRVRNNEPQPRTMFLDLRPVFLDEVEIFAPAPNEGVPDRSGILLGDHIEIGRRPALSPSFVASVVVPAGESVFFIRIKTSSSTALRGSLRSPSSMITGAVVQAIRFGMFEGIFLLMGIANLVFWLSLRERAFLSYGLALLVQAAVLLGNNNFLPPEFLPGGGAGVDVTLGVLVCISHIVGAWFVSDLLNARRNFPLLHKCFIALGALAALSAIAASAGYYQWVIGPLLVSGVLNFLLGIIGNFRLARRGVPGAAMAGFALLAILAGSITTIGRLLGYISFNMWSDYAFEAAMIVFIFHMQVALAQRARRAENERLAAQALALETARTAEQEASRLVELRTRELASAKEIAEQALQAEREIQSEQLRFIDVISHQYKTPLSVVSNSVAAIARTLAPADLANRERVLRCRRAIDRLVELIDVNLHRSRLDGVAVSADMQSVNIEAFLADVVSREADLHVDRQIELTIDPALSGVSMALDPAMIGLAIANLVENADKFSPAGASIDVAAEPVGEGVAIRVRDRGIGIPDDERDKLTQKYFRASNSANTSGMGLGLNMIATIVRRHDGMLRFESAAGGGTEVTIVLPLRRAPGNQPFASFRATSMAK
ncbi:sensor histidine kinase [Rhizobium sp. KVB221]|uniref:histidine kinase n=1 Tax=Rhizobium setariae TaxID=2801340 RepID=A0A936YJG8_9HYPH|nr:sensor histidine kinase [Rhizobium setariae]MBL0371308.1 sensor histidine kinase [Rhizobium setariae]